MDDIRDIGGFVDNMKILAARLANESWERAICAQVMARLRPKFLKYRGAAGEMKASKFSMGERNVHDVLSRSRQKLDDAVRQSGFHQALVNKKVGQDGERGRLPEDHIAHKRRCGRKIPTDGGEVERRQCYDKALLITMRGLELERITAW